jgi:selenocysteine-specific elongation factor
VAVIGPLQDRAIPEIAGGSQAVVRLRLEAPAVLTRGDRYILRAYSPPTTVAGGLILDPRPPRSAIRSRAALERVQALLFDPAVDDRAAAEQRAAAIMVGDAGQAGLSLAAMVSRVAVDPATLDSRVDALVTAGQAVRAGDVLVSPPIAARLENAIVATLTAHHRAHPLSEGIHREELREQLFGHGHASVFERVLADLARAGTIAVRRGALANSRSNSRPKRSARAPRSSARTATPVSRRQTRRRSPPPPALLRRSPIA